MTTRQIGAKLGANHQTIRRRLIASGVDLRPPGPDRHEQLRCKKWLHEHYVVKRKSTVKIAEQIGASPHVVATWLETHGIDRRERNQHKGRKWSAQVRKNMSAAKKGRNTGESNPNWRGGKIHPDKRLRSSIKTRNWSKAVRARDGHKCVECGATGRLHAHHIKPWKDYPKLRHELSNGITLCPPCHSRAHGFPFKDWVYKTKSPRVRSA